jgi:sirohydrochlorin ferrochelatase
MTPPTNGAGRFRIELTPHFAARITALYHLAAARGQETAFRTALRRLRQRLELDPFSCGEPVYALQELGLIVRKVVQVPIVLHYTAHAERRLVWFTAIDLLG